MTTGELKKLLADLPDETLVVMAKDGEGNSFSPFDSVSEGSYFESNKWSGDFYTTTGTPKTGGWQPAICLWPVS